MDSFFASRRVKILLIVLCLCLPQGAYGQVVSLDPNYSVSLFASGIELPDGLAYRAATNDMLVTEEDLGLVVRVDATTGTASQFADLRPYSVTNHGHFVGVIRSLRKLM